MPKSLPNSWIGGGKGRISGDFLGGNPESGVLSSGNLNLAEESMESECWEKSAPSSENLAPGNLRSSLRESVKEGSEPEGDPNWAMPWNCLARCRQESIADYWQFFIN